MLGIEDHGIMTFLLNLDYGGSGQAAGGYSLMSSKPHNDRTACGIAILRRILEVVGVDKWEKLEGKHIRAKASHDKVYAIGNITEDKWLDFGQFAMSFKKEENV